MKILPIDFEFEGIIEDHRKAKQYKVIGMSNSTQINMFWLSEIVTEDVSKLLNIGSIVRINRNKQLITRKVDNIYRYRLEYLDDYKILKAEDLVDLPDCNISKKFEDCYQHDPYITINRLFEYNTNISLSNIVHLLSNYSNNEDFKIIKHFEDGKLLWYKICKIGFILKSVKEVNSISSIKKNLKGLEYYVFLYCNKTDIRRELNRLNYSDDDPYEIKPFYCNSNDELNDLAICSYTNLNKWQPILPARIVIRGKETLQGLYMKMVIFTDTIPDAIIEPIVPGKLEEIRYVRI